MIEPIDKEIDGKIYVLTKFPAIQGREILTQYPVSALPKLGDYKTNEALMMKLLCYVGVHVDTMAIPLMLTNENLVNNHVKSANTLLKIEWAMLEYNECFFADGRVSVFLRDIAQKLPRWITKILTALLAELSKAGKPPTTN